MMKLSEFFKKTAPFYKHIKENKSDADARDFLRMCFRDYVMRELSEDELLDWMVKVIDEKFDSEKIALKADLYLDEYDVNTDKLDELVDLLGGILG